MSTIQKEYDPGAVLLELYDDLAYVKKLGYSIGEIGDRILVVALIDADCDSDEFFARSLAAVRKAREFRDTLPADLRSAYEVVPIVTDPDEGALRHFRSINAVIDR